MGNRQPELERCLRANAMDAQRRQQAHHATRHAQGHFGQRSMLTERAPRQNVDAASDALELTGRDQSAEHRGRQTLLSHFARAAVVDARQARAQRVRALDPNSCRILLQ